MGKRTKNETEEERKERKRAKKEAKKRSSIEPPPLQQEQQADDDNDNDEPAAPVEKVATIDGSKDSCQRKTVRMFFSMYPSDLEDIMREIKRSLRTKLLRYMTGLEGVLLAFDNIKILPNGGRVAGVILNEQPQIHYQVDLDTLCFCPTQHMRLKGTVTECFESHVGLLVHNYFNASVTSDQLVSAGYYFEDGSWVNEEHGSTMAAEEVVQFTVDRVHECAGTISMEGVDPSVCYESL